MSPKNKGNFGKGKPAVEPDDEFVSGMARVAETLKPHARPLIITGVGILVLMFSLAGYQQLSIRSEGQATALYREALALSQRTIDPNQDQDAAVTAPSEEPPGFPSIEARGEAVIEVLERLKAEHGSTDTAQSAQLLHAGVLYELARYQDAVAMYQSYLASNTNPSLEWVAREGLGYAQEAMALADASNREAGLKQAMETFQQLQPAEEGPRREYALYHKARILTSLSQPQEAITTLEQALEAAANDSPLRNDIKQQLAQLKAAAKE